MEFICKSAQSLMEQKAAEQEYAVAQEDKVGREYARCAGMKTAEAIADLKAGRMGRLPETRFDEFKLAIENLTGGANTVLLDDIGMPSIVVGLPKQRLCDLYAWGSEDIHPAWIIDGKIQEVLYISKYMNFVAHNRAYSLPMKDPHIFFTYEDGINFCLNKGKGWHLFTNYEWMAVAALSKVNNTRPRGNTGWGYSHAASHEKGIPTAMDKYLVQRTATGSGPVTWNHNHQAAGIADLVGNMFEWVGGLRLLEGEIQITPNNTAACYDANMLKADSHYWRAITTWGDYAAHGEKESFKVDSLQMGDGLERDHLLGTPVLSTRVRSHSYTGDDRQGNHGYTECFFADLQAEEGLEVPDLLRLMGVFPCPGDTRQDGIFVARNYGERMAVRGGKAGSFERGGLNALHFYNPRTYDGSATIGFRSAYAEL